MMCHQYYKDKNKNKNIKQFYAQDVEQTLS